MSAADDQAGARGAAWLEAEIAQRGLSLRKIETESGVAYRTLQKILGGEPLTRRDRRAALARALGYRGDAFDLVERGEQPVTLVQEQLAQSSPRPPDTVAAADTRDYNSRIPRLSPEDQKTIDDLIDRFERDREDR